MYSLRRLVVAASPYFCLVSVSSLWWRKQEERKFPTTRSSEFYKYDHQKSKMSESKGENADGDVNKSTKGEFWSDERIENVVKMVLKKLNDYWSLSWQEEETGSIFTGSQEIHNYDYDYLLCPTKVECRIEPSSLNPCYCSVFITNKDVLPPEFQAILEPNDELSPSKYKEFIFGLFEKILKGSHQLTRIENKSWSPAYTVTHRFDMRKPIDIDLVPCLRVQNPPESYLKWKTRKLTEEEKKSCPFYVVPKNYVAGSNDELPPSKYKEFIFGLFDGIIKGSRQLNEEELDLWRLSFSTFERKIIRDKCDKFERMVIQVIKHMLISAGKSEDQQLCSYHITTNFLNFFEKTPSMSEHEYPGDLGEYQHLALDSMIFALQSKDIPHFFIPNINLLQDVDVEDCQRFVQKLKDYKEYMDARIQGKPPPRQIHHHHHHHY